MSMAGGTCLFRSSSEAHTWPSPVQPNPPSRQTVSVLHPVLHPTLPGVGLPRHPRGKQSTSRVYKANQLQGWMRSHFTNCLRGPSQRETLTPVSKVKALGGPLSYTPPGGHSVPPVVRCHKNLAHSWNYFLLCTLWDYCLGKEKGLDLTPAKRWGERGGVAHPARGV